MRRYCGVDLVNLTVTCDTRQRFAFHNCPEPLLRMKFYTCIIALSQWYVVFASNPLSMSDLLSLAGSWDQVPSVLDLQRILFSWRQQSL